MTAQSCNLLVSLVAANIFLHGFKKENRKEPFLCYVCLEEKQTWDEVHALHLWLRHKKVRLLCYSDEKPSMHALAGRLGEMGTHIWMTVSGSWKDEPTGVLHEGKKKIKISVFWWKIEGHPFLKQKYSSYPKGKG